MGLELAENFKHRGLDVTLIDQLPQVAFLMIQKLLI